MNSVVMHAIEVGDGSTVTFRVISGERCVTVTSRRRPATARALLIHGLGDHAGRHIGHARRLAARGYETTIVELAGHGGQAFDWAYTLGVYDAYATSAHDAELLGWFENKTVFPDTTTSLLADRQYERLGGTTAADHLAQIGRVLAHLQAAGATDHLPLFIVGHSLGGLLAHETMWRMSPSQRTTVTGLVLIAPAFAPQGNPASPAMQLAVNGLWSLRRLPISPTRTATKALLDLNFPVDTTWGKPWLSDVAREVELFATDPLVPHRLPTRYANSLESLMAASSLRAPGVPYEALMLLPRTDGITSRQAAVSFAERANAATGTPRVARATFDVTAHDLLRSSAGGRALHTILQWMDGRVQARMPHGVTALRAS